MKRFLAVILILALFVSVVFCLSACGKEKRETAAEKSARLRDEADAARAAADKAAADYQKLQDDIARYNQLMDAINNAKPAN